MIDFVTSLNKGLELAQQADENNKEIDAVFAELNRQHFLICEDKESLELAIADLLADPFVAKTLFKVINAESTESVE